MSRELWSALHTVADSFMVEKLDIMDSTASPRPEKSQTHQHRSLRHIPAQTEPCGLS